MEIIRKDIKDMKAFEKFGDLFTQIGNNPETGWYLYERVNKESGKKHYEVVKGKKHKNPDGSIVYAFPSTELWGTYGYSIDDNRYSQKLIEFLMESKSRTPQEIYDFKKAL